MGNESELMSNAERCVAIFKENKEKCIANANIKGHAEGAFERGMAAAFGIAADLVKGSFGIE